MTTRLMSALVLAVSLALVCTSVSIAAAWAPTDAAHFDGRSPDTRDAAWLVRRVRHVSGRAVRSQIVVRDGRSPDTKDAAVAARMTPSPVIILGATGFDWTDAGIGAVAGFGLAAISAAALGLTRSRQTYAAS